MAFEWFTDMFSGGSPSANIMPGDMPTGRDAGGIVAPPPYDPQTGKPNPGGGVWPGGGTAGGGDNWWLPLLLGGGATIASKLINRGTDKDIARANKALRAGTDVASGAGKTMVDRASRGELTDPQKASVDRMKAEQNAQWNQYLSNLGIPVSTAKVQGANLVEANASKFANDLINQSFSQGLEALKLGTTAAQAQLSAAMGQRADTSKAIWDVAQEIGRVFNTPEKKPTTTTGMPATAYVPPEMTGGGGYDITPTSLTEEDLYNPDIEALLSGQQ